MSNEMTAQTAETPLQMITRLLGERPGLTQDQLHDTLRGVSTPDLNQALQQALEADLITVTGGRYALKHQPPDHAFLPFTVQEGETCGERLLRLLTEQPLLDEGSVARTCPDIHPGVIQDVLDALTAQGTLRRHGERYATDRGLLLLALQVGVQVDRAARNLKATLPDDMPGEGSTPEGERYLYQSRAVRSGTGLKHVLEEGLYLHRQYLQALDDSQTLPHQPKPS